MPDMVSYHGMGALLNKRCWGLRGGGGGNFCFNENWYSDNIEASVHLF